MSRSAIGSLASASSVCASAADAESATSAVMSKRCMDVSFLFRRLLVRPLPASGERGAPSFSTTDRVRGKLHPLTQPSSLKCHRVLSPQAGRGRNNNRPTHSVPCPRVTSIDQSLADQPFLNHVSDLG